MKRWFTRLPIHRKLVVMALLVSTVALVIANTGLTIIDAWRYRTTAFDEAVSAARVIAENTAASVRFKDVEGARGSLESLRVRPSVTRACLYLAEGPLFAQFTRSSDLACPPRQPPASDRQMSHVAGAAPVTSNDRIIGTVIVERDLSDLWTRLVVAGLTSLAMLILAGSAALLLADRLNRTVSGPITQLAAAARAIRPDDHSFAPPQVAASDDEIGDLVRAFSEMLRRVQTASAEREQLLVREREASRLKDEFLAAVSHELRTPLNAIVGWVQILTTTAASEQTVARGIAAIARNARAQTRVIEDLVDVSRFATGKMNIRFDPVDFREVIDNAVEVSRAAADASGVALRVDVGRDPCLVNGDRDRLQQVVWNLLSNAIKFTLAGGTIDVVLAPVDDVVELRVIDSGGGIPASFLPHVFDRFRQADGSMTREHGGLGLGLAIVKELTELHGGTVAASSEGVGRGSTFTIRLPRMAGTRPERSAAGRRPFGDAASPLAGLHIVAADDNEDSLDVLAEMLSAAGACVRVVAGGAAAIREWEREPADVFLCDLAMPGLDGFEVLKAIRRIDDRDGRRTPAVALTAHVSDDYRRESLRAGFDAHLSKPFDAAHLAAALATLTGRR